MSRRPWSVALGSLIGVGGFVVSGCPPSAPTDGFYGCATGACPSQFPYCDPVELRCYAEVPTDGGPRPDAWHMSGTIGRFGACTSNDECQSQFECLGGACVTPCTPTAGGGGCGSLGSGYVCGPVHLTTAGSAFGCVPPVMCGQACTDAPLHSREDRGAHVCQCVPMGWD